MTHSTKYSTQHPIVTEENPNTQKSLFYSLPHQRFYFFSGCIKSYGYASKDPGGRARDDAQQFRSLRNDLSVEKANDDSLFLFCIATKWMRDW